MFTILQICYQMHCNTFYKLVGGGYSYGPNGDQQVPGDGFAHLREGEKRGISLCTYYSKRTFIHHIWCHKHQNNNTFHLGPYFCSKSGCHWQNFTQNIEWGYYNDSNGDCGSCRIKCQDDPTCKAFECGSSYCSWWAKGTCDDMRNETLVNTDYKTCRVLGTLM